ncbi:hypothetical protein RHS01_10600 [Rhizoctonia solani]|uniref:Reverse transcriptase n=1 Tax=Rhizoctonia solani TaxID=456999 RepID=A0A8H7M2A9_9AGAM|nr:hypothetical protein RHS01_10600 [Rhizoctonia solani]
MEPEPTLASLLEAIQTLTSQVGSLQAQIHTQGQQLSELKAICKETNDLVGDKDQGGAQAKPGPSTGPITPPTHTGGEAHTPGTVRPGLKAPFCPSRGTGFDSEEEEEPRRAPKKEPCNTPRRSLSSLTPFDAGSSVKRPKMELPDPYKGDSRGRKATQWLDECCYKAANWALPIIGTIIKGKGNPPTTIPALTAKFKEAFADPNAKRAAARKIAALTQSTTTAEYVTKFRNLMAELDWNTEAFIAQFTRGHWKVKELLSPRTTFRTMILRPYLPPQLKLTISVGKTRRTALKSSCQGPGCNNHLYLHHYHQGPLIRGPQLRYPGGKRPPRASGLCVKCGQKGHGIKQCPNGWKATIKEVAKVAEDESGKERYHSQTGRIWHQVQLAVLANGHPHTIPFLVCPIGNTPAILGMTWLTAEAPLIDWQQGLVTFPKQIQIASKEEADSDPLVNLPLSTTNLILDAKLTPGPIYGMTDAESKALKQHIDKELATGKIRPSTSSTGAPVMFVKKADGSLRLVVDYQKLNDVTHKNVYPLPRQDDLMAKLRHAKIFTKLDLRWGYNNVRIKEGDEWKTAFRTKYGLFEYLVMPFGLTNAPAAFQHFMNNLFRDLIDVTVVIYLDDILIFSEKPEDHPAHLSKCHFHVNTVDYLGIVISPAGFSMDQKKIEAVTSWPQPKTVKQVQAFLGFVNYLRRFIPNFSSVARPLHNLTKKETPWSWSNPEEAAFQELKLLVTQSPVLAHSNPDLPYYLETDASGVAMGAILSQQGLDNRLHPVAYMSKSFSGAEANYDTHDKELLAIIKALEEWRIFLEATDRPIQVFTDHWNLEYWMQAQTFNQRHARWRIFLSNFNFEIHYRPGKQSGKPDALSRRSDYTDEPREPEVMLPAEVFANTLEEELDIVTEIRSKLREDPSLDQIIQFLTEDADNAPPPSERPIGIMTGRKTSCGIAENWATENLGTPQPKLLVARHEVISQGMGRMLPHLPSQSTRSQPSHSLETLEVPPFPFHTISYNFITGFPKSEGYDAILVVIDSFSKFGHFIPTSKKVSAKGLANLFVTHIWKLHGLPVRTISDQGTTFTGKFLRALYQRLGIKPSFSLAYHPESDRQTERVNQFIKFYLRSYVAADHLDWVKWLPLAEYAYNNAKHAATKKTPFELVYGRNPIMNPSTVPANVPEADLVADTLAQEWQEAESALRMTKERMARPKGTIPEYSVGKKVWLDGKNVVLRTNSNKLDPKRLGPFKVTEKISSHAYRLRLPDTLKIHDVFYVGLLSKARKSPSQPFPKKPPPETIEGEEEYEVEQIIDSKQQRGKWFYLIKWKGYGPEDNSWEPEELLEHSQEEIQRFNKSQLKKACDSAKSL